MLILWDSTDSPPDHDGMLYRWNGYAETDDVHSLLRYIEDHGERLRSKYLAWIHDIGESQFYGKRLIDHLAFEDGFSYWWMTLFVEKSLYKSPISDAIRLLALEEIVVQQMPKKIKIVSDNRWLNETISGLCLSLRIDYEWERLPVKKQPLNRERIYRSLPLFVQALLSLARHLRVSWPFRRAATSGWLKGDHTLFFCGYFANIVPEEAATGHFHSRYWEGLHELMQKMGIKANWLHHNATFTYETALGWVQRFNRNRQEQAFHTFLDAFVSWCVVLRVIRKWLWLNIVSWRLGHQVEAAFRPQGCHLSLWPLMRGYWKTSLRGVVAVGNLFVLELFDVALRVLPMQKKGLYLSENNEWERALIYMWRKHGHGQLIAVIHSMVRFWDLCYFTDPRILQSLAPSSIPQPDLTVLNGMASMKVFPMAEYPKEALVECEALRYGYLNKLGKKSSSGKTENNLVRVLILGDFLLSSTIKLLQLIKAAAPLIIAGRFTYTIKPHPVSIIKPEDYCQLDLRKTMEPLGKIINDYHVVFACNYTSAAVDAYLAGLPVVVMLNDSELNFSPLRGNTGVRFVSTPEELAEALQTPGLWAATNPDRNEFFFLDPDLPRWRSLLSQPPVYQVGS